MRLSAFVAREASKLNTHLAHNASAGTCTGATNTPLGRLIGAPMRSRLVLQSNIRTATFVIVSIALTTTAGAQPSKGGFAPSAAPVPHVAPAPHISTAPTRCPPNICAARDVRSSRCATTVRASARAMTSSLGTPRTYRRRRGKTCSPRSRRRRKANCSMASSRTTGVSAW
jgi:hypothetical protein